jgi:glutamate carboxypeptidase
MLFSSSVLPYAASQYTIKTMDLKKLQSLLITWSNINSGSGNWEGLAAMRKALIEAFSVIKGAEIKEIKLQGTDAHAISVRVRPKAKRQVLLSGHYDTVFEPTHRFQNAVLKNEDILNGPGVADMKGGILVMLAALLDLESSTYADALGYEVLLTPDEETGSVASRPEIEARAGSKEFQFALVFEPARSNGDLVKSRKGTGIFKLKVHGKAAHAGRDPAQGRNAILALCECLPLINQLPAENPSIMVNVGSIQGGGVVNVVPDFASAEVNIRITKKSDEGVVQKRLSDISEFINTKDGYRIEITGGFNRPPKENTPTEDRLFEVWKACAAKYKVSLDWQHVGGGSDGNLMSAVGLPNLDGLGPVGDCVHSADEYIHISSLVTRSQIAAEFLKRTALDQMD